MPRCDHCLIEFPEREAVRDTDAGSARVFCCHGCQGVFRLANDEGLDDYYPRRIAWTPASWKTRSASEWSWRARSGMWVSEITPIAITRSLDFSNDPLLS